MVSINEETKKLPEVPNWTKDMSCQAWIREVEMWSDLKAKPEKKAQALIESIKKMDEKKDLKDFIINEIVGDASFDRRSTNSVKNILKKVKEFFNESK